VRRRYSPDVIAGDVANPAEISTTFDSIGGLGDTKQALQEIVILPLLRPELFAGGKGRGGEGKDGGGGGIPRRPYATLPAALARPLLSVTPPLPPLHRHTHQPPSCFAKDKSSRPTFFISEGALPKRS
jgi:hypothetical protein